MEKNRAFPGLEVGLVRGVFLGLGGEAHACGQLAQFRPVAGITNDREARIVVPGDQRVLRIRDKSWALPVVKECELAADLGGERKRTMAGRAPEIIIQKALPFFPASEVLLPS